TLGVYDHEVGSSHAKRSRNVETVEEALLPDVHHEFLEWRGCSRETKSRYNSRAFNIREPIYLEICREFYATYEFDEVCADDELQSKKIISFRLGGRAHSLTLLEFARRLGLYHTDELEEEGFDTYFQGGYTSEWICKCGLGDCKMDKKEGSWKLEGQSDLLWTTLRELIDSEDRLIHDIPVDDEPRVATQRAPRVQRASMQDLYECMGSMEIRQEAIERMEYRQAYH
ncbi:hypothetical protein Tco_1476465, partial [Tanacetum coccineum]